MHCTKPPLCLLLLGDANSPLLFLLLLAVIAITVIDADDEHRDEAFISLSVLLDFEYVLFLLLDFEKFRAQTDLFVDSKQSEGASTRGE